jgi:CheY-like chemotaxis protein
MPDSVMSRILVVDDEEEYRIMVQNYLQMLGYGSDFSAGATEALEILSKDHFDLVISDILMTGKDGLQLMREALDKYPHLRFIIMTGHAGDYTFSDIIDAGASDFISKPFPVAELKAKLERIEREKAILQELQKKNEELSRAAEIHASFADLSRALLSPLSFESISDLILSYAKQLTESEIGFVGYIDQQNGYLVCPTMSREVWENCHVEDKNIVLKKFGGLWGWVLENRELVLTNVLREDIRSTGVPAGHLPIHRFLSAPAMAEDQLIGQVSLANSTRDYTETDAVLVRRIADIYALVIHRKWADENLRRTEEDLRKARDELQKLVEERTAKLSEAGEVILRSIHRFREIAEE